DVRAHSRTAEARPGRHRPLAGASTGRPAGARSLQPDLRCPRARAERPPAACACPLQPDPSARPGKEPARGGVVVGDMVPARTPPPPERQLDRRACTPERDWARMRRALVAAVAPAVIAIAIAGCGGGSSHSGNSTTP